MIKSIVISVYSIFLLQSNNVMAQNKEVDYLQYALEDSIVQSHISMHMESEEAMNLNVEYLDSLFVFNTREGKSDSCFINYADVLVKSIKITGPVDNKKIKIDLSINMISTINIKLAYRDRLLYVRKVKGNTRSGKKMKSSIYLSNY